MPTPTILLFDIDGTLITTGGAARRALEVAMAERVGVETFEAGFSFGGMTDRAIFRGCLQQAGHPATEEAIDATIAAYLARLDAVLETAPDYRVHDGVRAVLDAVSGRANVAVGLGTGNVERGARTKLQRVGLNPYFGFGGFGCDAEARPDLILRGAQRGAEALGQPLDACRVVIIGDTTRDVHAAHSNGFECVAVSTGGDDHAVLRDANPEHCFASLADDGALHAILPAAA